MCTEEQGVGCDDIINDYDIINVTSELMIPSWIPFPTIIYKPILRPFILTWSLHDTPPTKVSPVLRLKIWILYSLTYHVVYSSLP